MAVNWCWGGWSDRGGRSAFCIRTWERSGQMHRHRCTIMTSVQKSDEMAAFVIMVLFYEMTPQRSLSASTSKMSSFGTVPAAWKDTPVRAQTSHCEPTPAVPDPLANTTQAPVIIHVALVTGSSTPGGGGQPCGRWGTTATG